MDIRTVLDMRALSAWLNLQLGLTHGQRKRGNPSQMQIRLSCVSDAYIRRHKTSVFFHRALRFQPAFPDTQPLLPIVPQLFLHLFNEIAVPTLVPVACQS